jgi:hypothetical protein
MPAPSDLPRAPPASRPRVARRARDATAGLTVTRLADGGGAVSFARTPYACGRRWARTAIDVSIVAGSVQLSRDGKVIRIHPIRHDRSRELGAFANPKGRPRRKNSATGNVALRSCRLGTGTHLSPRYRYLTGRGELALSLTDRLQMARASTRRSRGLNR